MAADAAMAAGAMAAGAASTGALTVAAIAAALQDELPWRFTVTNDALAAGLRSAESTTAMMMRVTVAGDAAVVDYSPATAADGVDASLLATAARRAAAVAPPAAEASLLPTPLYSEPLAGLAMRYALPASVPAVAASADGAAIDGAALAAAILAAQFDYEQSACAARGGRAPRIRSAPASPAPAADYHAPLCDVENIADKLGEDGVVALLVEARDRSHRKHALTATFVDAMTAALDGHGYTGTRLRDGTGVECVLSTKAGPVRTRHRLTHLTALSAREPASTPAAATTGAAGGAVISGGGTSGGVTMALGTISVAMSELIPSER